MKLEKPIKQIDNYCLLRELGKGATARVYQGFDITTKQLVAIKVVSTQKIQEAHLEEAIKRELDALKNFSHDNIIKIQKRVHTSNNIYIMLEYCNGSTLSHFNTLYQQKYQKQISEEIVQKILKQLVQGLNHMHENNYIHRDIKLDNILLNFDEYNNTYNSGYINEIPFEKLLLLDKPFTVKIADLGFARALNEMATCSSIYGTPITMAPDVFNFTANLNSPHSYNSKADLWSLGAITYELLIGKPPFFAHSKQELFNQVKKGKYLIPKKMTLSIEAITFLNGLLQYYPEKRMDWPQILSHPFLTNKIENFHYIDLERNDIHNEDGSNIELNAKEGNNFLWLLMRNSSFNFALDQMTNDNEELKKVVNTDKLKRGKEGESKINNEVKKDMLMITKAFDQSILSKVDHKKKEDEYYKLVSDNERLKNEVMILQKNVELLKEDVKDKEDYICQLRKRDEELKELHQEIDRLKREKHIGLQIEDNYCSIDLSNNIKKKNNWTIDDSVINNNNQNESEWEYISSQSEGSLSKTINRTSKCKQSNKQISCFLDNYF